MSNRAFLRERIDSSPYGFLVKDMPSSVSFSQDIVCANGECKPDITGYNKYKAIAGAYECQYGVRTGNCKEDRNDIPEDVAYIVCHKSGMTYTYSMVLKSGEFKQHVYTKTDVNDKSVWKWFKTNYMLDQVKEKAQRLEEYKKKEMINRLDWTIKDVEVQYAQDNGSYTLYTFLITYKKDKPFIISARGEKGENVWDSFERMYRERVIKSIKTTSDGVYSINIMLWPTPAEFVQAQSERTIINNQSLTEVVQLAYPDIHKEYITAFDIKEDKDTGLFLKYDVYYD